MAKESKAAAASSQVTIRVTPAVIERATALVETVAAETGRATTVTDVYREAMMRGFRELERLRDRGSK